MKILFDLPGPRRVFVADLNAAFAALANPPARRREVDAVSLERVKKRFICRTVARDIAACSANLKFRHAFRWRIVSGDLSLRKREVAVQFIDVGLLVVVDSVDVQLHDHLHALIVEVVQAAGCHRLKSSSDLVG